MIRFTIGALIAMLVGLIPQVRAQSLNDIILYSQSNPAGLTARGMALSNALGAVGADFSSFGTNPAGLGVFQNSSIDLAFSGALTKNLATYEEVSTSRYAPFASFEAISASFSLYNRMERAEDQISIRAGFSYNTTARYRGNLRVVSGYAPESMLDAWVKFARANDITMSNLSSENATKRYNWNLIALYDAKLFDPDHEDYPLAHIGDQDLFQQVLVIDQHGYKREADVALGMNYHNKLYFGLNAGIEMITRRWLRIFGENVESLTAMSGTSSYALQEENADYGVGVNVRLGVIYRPMDQWRLGFAFQTPSFVGVSSKSQLTAQANFYEYQGVAGKLVTSEASSEMPEAKYDYSYMGPLRTTLSAAYFFGQYGFISADYQMAYIPGSKFYDSNLLDEENRLLSHQTKARHELRLGAELLLNIFSLRAGGGFSTSPYKQSLLPEYGLRYFYSAGVGVNWGWMYCDLGFQQVTQQGEHFMYAIGDARPAYRDVRDQWTISLSLGVIF